MTKSASRGARPLRRHRQGKPPKLSDLLDQIVGLLRRHMVLPEGAADAIALWVAHTHAFEAAQISPRLLIRSAEKQSGKTSLMLILQHLVRKPHSVSSITGPGIFRAVAAWHPTLIMDEADNYVAKSDDIAAILNSGHNRAMASVTRCVGPKFMPTNFTTWSPVAIACIGRQRDTLEDRSIIIPIRRRPRSEKVMGLRLDKMDEFTAIQKKLETWHNKNIIALTRSKHDPQVPDELTDRAADNWRPLLAIADYASDKWPERARYAARRLTPSTADDDSIGTQLLIDIRAAFVDQNIDRIGSVDLADALADLEDRRWGEYNKGRPITPYQISKRLRGFDIVSKVIRIGDRTPHGYQLEQFADAFARYLPEEAATPQQASQVNDIEAEVDATESATCETDAATATASGGASTAPVAGDVADREAKNGSEVNAVADVADVTGYTAKPNGADSVAAERPLVFDAAALLNTEHRERRNSISRLGRRQRRTGGRLRAANVPNGDHCG
jgi:putative DNA primase/helicase